MTAVRRLTLILCLSVSTLLAQTAAPKAKANEKPASPAETAAAAPKGANAPAAEAAQNPPTRPRTEAVVVATDKDVENPRALRLSLDEAIRTSMQQNLGIELSRYDFRAAGESLRGAFGPFDPQVTADIERTKSQSPVTSLLASTNSSRTTVNYGLQELAPTGGTYGVAFNNFKSRNNNPFQSLNPQIGSSLGLGISQPLLRNFGIDVNTRAITIARNSLGISREAFRSVLINTANAVEQAYLDLVYTRQNVEVAKQTLFLARDQERITQIRIDVGASAPLDILQPQVSVATAEETLISAQAGVRSAEDRLRQLMNLPPADWDRPILPTEPVTYTPFHPDVDSSVARALTDRPELRQADLSLSNQKVQALYARNQTLPRVDFGLNYGYGGAAGKLYQTNSVTGQREVVDHTRYGSALRQIFSADFPSWTVALNVGIPITNIGARAAARAAALGVQRTVTDRANTELAVMVDVRQAVRNVDTAAQQTSATRTGREAAEKNYEAERKRYENGMSTNFNVLSIQNQLDDARRSELQALVGYRKAVTDYHRAVGDLLEVRRISVTDPETFRTPMIPFQNVHWLNYGSFVKDDTGALK